MEQLYIKPSRMLINPKVHVNQRTTWLKML